MVFKKHLTLNNKSFKDIVYVNLTAAEEVGDQNLGDLIGIEHW